MHAVTADGMHNIPDKSNFHIHTHLHKLTLLCTKNCHTLSGWDHLLLLFEIYYPSLQYIQSKCKRDSGINTEIYVEDSDPKSTAKYMNLYVFLQISNTQKRRSNKYETSFFCVRCNIICIDLYRYTKHIER